MSLHLHRRLSFWERVWFLTRFARTDLFESRAWWTTGVCWFIMALLTGLTLVALSLPLAGEEAQRLRLKRTPLALSLWVYHRALGRKLTSDDLDGLRRALEARAARPADVLGCYPFHEIELSWAVPAATQKRSVLLKGRTLAVNDPMFKGDSCPLRSGQKLEHADWRGVIVTPLLLDALGLPRDTSAGALLHVLGLSVKPEPVPIVGVTVAEELPLGHLFVLTEAFEQELRTRDPDVRLLTVEKVVPAAWPAPRDLPPTALEAIATCDIERPKRGSRDGSTIWTFRSRKDQGHWRSEWQRDLRWIHQKIAENYPRAEHFDEVELPPGVKQEPPKREGYDMAVVYVEDLPALQPAADAIEASGWLVDKGVIAKLNDYAEAARAQVRVLFGVLIVSGIIASLALIAVQWLRLQPKVPEIGLLRAVGMDDGLLQGVYAMEAAFLWLLGTGSGLVLAALFGCLLLWWYAAWEVSKVLLSGFWLGWSGGYLVFSFGLCWASIWGGTFAARRDAPAASLNASS